MISNPESLQETVQRAANEYVGLLNSTSDRWPFFYGLEEGRTMRWGGSKVFSTIHYPPALRVLYEKLCDLLPSLAHQCPDCLPTWYEPGRISLNYHQDKSCEKLFGRRELVLLLFAGAPRNLAIKRHRQGRIIEILRCTALQTIVLTPAANKIFFHAKLPEDVNTSSLTFAFRRGKPAQ